MPHKHHKVRLGDTINNAVQNMNSCLSSEVMLVILVNLNVQNLSRLQSSLSLTTSMQIFRNSHTARNKRELIWYTFCNKSLCAMTIPWPCFSQTSWTSYKRLTNSADPLPKISPYRPVRYNSWCSDNYKQETCLN